MHQLFDVIIIGGGPAGSTCALALAGSGLHVAVIEKAGFPRNKVCGDAVAAYVPKVLGTIHSKYADAIKLFADKTIVNTCRIIAPNEKYIDVTSHEAGFIATRMAWDNFLYELSAEEKNINWFTNYEVTNVTIDHAAQQASVIANGRVFRSKLVIGCDGAHSITSKNLTTATLEKKHYAGAVRAYYENVGGFTNNTYELHFIKNILPGYFWIFPLPGNMANVGLCIPSPVIAKKKINLRQVMKDIICTHPSIKKRFDNAILTGKIEGYGLPLGSKKTIVSGSHFMLCGDAASLIDPATGEGIGQSMISGRYAGWQAMKCFEKNDFSAAFMKQYDEQLHKKLWREARISYRIRDNFFKHERLFNGTFNFLSNNKFIRQLVLHRIVEST